MKFYSLSISLVSFFLWGFALQNYAQQYNYRHYTTQDGLPSSNVFSVKQDSKGFLWFGTSKGVARFDGYSFKTYTMEDGLHDNNVLEVHEDVDGRIWFRTYLPGLSYLENDSIYPFPTAYKKLNDTLNGKMINHIDFKGDKLVLFTQGGAFNIDKQYEQIEKISLDTTMFESLYFSEKTKSKNKLNYKNKYKDAQAFGYVPIREKFTITGRPRGMAFQLDSSVLWIFRDKFIYVIKDEVFIEKVLLPDAPISVCESGNDRVMISMFNEGVFELPKGNFDFEKAKRFLPGKSVTSIAIDHEGGYWFSTINAGVFYLADKNFTSLTQENGLSGKSVAKIAFRENEKGGHEVFLGYMFGSVNKLIDKKVEKDYEGLMYDEGFEMKEKFYLTSSITKGENNDILIATGGDYLNVISKQGGMRIVKMNVEESFRCFVSDEKGMIWGAGYEHIVGWDSKTEEQVWRYKINQRSNDIFISKQGIVWVGTDEGVWQIKNDTCVPLNHVQGAFPFRITAIGQYRDYILLTTDGYGLLFINETDVNDFFFVSSQYGLSSTICQGIDADDEGIWLATNKGVNYISFANGPVDLSNINIQKYTFADGLISNETNAVCVVGDEVYVGTSEGLSVFNSKTKKINKSRPPIHIVGVQNKEEKTLDNNQVAYKDNTVLFQFLGISFKESENIIYKYRLKGLEDQWVKTRNTSVRFSELPPGDYIFEVQALNYFGNWSQAPASFQFTILTPYWMTWWFRLFIILSSAATITTFILWRFKQVKDKNQMKEQLHRVQQQALTAQINPHFLFNSLNSVNSFVINNDKLDASRYLSKFATLVRYTLDYSSKKYVTLDKEIAMVKNYLNLEQIRFSNQFTYEVLIPDNLDVHAITIPPMLFQPFLENSIWHGFSDRKKQGHIEIKFLKEENTVYCYLTDNGIGRKAAGKAAARKVGHDSKGMKITQKRMQLINQLQGKKLNVKIVDLEDEHGNPLGTQVQIKLVELNNE